MTNNDYKLYCQDYQEYLRKLLLRCYLKPIKYKFSLKTVRLILKRSFM